MNWKITPEEEESRIISIFDDDGNIIGQVCLGSGHFMVIDAVFCHDHREELTAVIQEVARESQKHPMILTDEQQKKVAQIIRLHEEARQLQSQLEDSLRDICGIDFDDFMDNSMDCLNSHHLVTGKIVERDGEEYLEVPHMRPARKDRDGSYVFIENDGEDSGSGQMYLRMGKPDDEDPQYLQIFFTF